MSSQDEPPGGYLPPIYPLKQEEPAVSYPSLPALETSSDVYNPPSKPRPEPTIQPTFQSAFRPAQPHDNPSPLASPAPYSPGGLKSSLSAVTQNSIPTSPSQPALNRSPSSQSFHSVGSRTPILPRSHTPTIAKKSSMASLRGSQTQSRPSSSQSRRQSSNMGTNFAPLHSPRRSLTPAVEEPPPKPAPTQASVAREVFEKELRNQADTPAETDMIVVLHDACYGHRFSRPRTTKTNLSLIVERPERVTAIIQGLSMAYVRLGGRHIGGAYPLHPKNATAALPFRIKKSTRSVPLEDPAVTQVHGVGWMGELKTMCEGAEAQLALDGKELTRPGGTSDDSKTRRPRLHEGDLYLCAESLNALQGALGGVCDAVDEVFEPSGPRRAFACVRPPGHHCSADYPSGFCWLNNVHVGIAYAMQNHGVTHAAIIDFDLHHGDGSQTITWAHNTRVNNMHKKTPLAKKSPIGYFSLHDINSYPCEWGDIEKVQAASLCIENSHGQTVWNVHLQTWKTEDEFWKLYEERYLVLIDKMRDFLQTRSQQLHNARRAAQAKANGRTTEIPTPKAAIFISAGFDASEHEGTGMQRHKVNVPTSFYARFTRDVAALSDEPGLGVEGRVISVLEGGYSDRALSSGVFSHVCGLANVKKTPPAEPVDLADQMSGLSMGGSQEASSKVTSVDESWWAPAHLDEFEAAKTRIEEPVAVTTGPKKSRTINPTYTTPTQASNARALPPRRSIGGHKQPSPPQVQAPPPRPPTPPAPPVEWSVAALELSKLLVPSERQTTSCRPEELAAPKRAKVRQSDIGVISVPKGSENEPAVTESKRTGLRERKAKPVYTSDHEDEKPKKTKAASKTSRRRTIGGAKSTTPVEEAPAVPSIPDFSDIVKIEQREQVPQDPMQLDSVPEQPALSMAPPPIQRALSDDQIYQQRPANGVGRLDESVNKPVNEANGIDGLAGQIKKMHIRLHVPSREEHEAREREREREKAEMEERIGQRLP